jgi:hypothetical protein
MQSLLLALVTLSIIASSVSSWILPQIIPSPHTCNRFFLGNIDNEFLSFNRCVSGIRSKRFRVFMTSTEEEFVQAEDLESLQGLFSSCCDGEGLMTKAEVMQIPSISELLMEGDLETEEFSIIWNKAPKFPDDSERIDVDSFVQIYRDIDDLFEDEDASEICSSETVQTMDTPAEKNAEENSKADEAMESELEDIYQALCGKNGLITKVQLKTWDEVQTLLEDGMLGDDEFEVLWDKTPKSPGSVDKLDVDGFFSFNVALDALFEFDDKEMMEDEMEPEGRKQDASGPTKKAVRGSTSLPLVEGEGLSPEALFDSIATSDGLVGKDEINRWRELRELLADGDILPSELQNIYAGVSKSIKDPSRLDKKGFLTFYKDVDDLFEDEEDPTAEDGDSLSKKKLSLYALLDEINSDEERLPCGLECTEREQQAIQDLVETIESESRNMIRTKQGAIEQVDLAGTWDLLYSSSSAMSYNKGLSGLGGSFPNGKFGGVTQKLTVSKVMTDVEYLERIDVTPSTASFDVKVTGDWGLSTSVSLFTGEPSTVLTVVPDRVSYGPTTTKADHWKSLGPLNMLDVTYLDEDLRIMRGNTSTETIFIFKRSD